MKRRKILRCSKCNRPRRSKGQRYCAKCHAESQRKWRAKRKREQAKLYSLLREDFLAVAMPKANAA